MKHYPDIQRQQGTLFFIPHGDRAAIAISIERLIDLLDASEGDPDFEANGDERDQSYIEGRDPGTNALEDDEDGSDDEPNLGSEERHPHIWCEPYTGDQTLWARGVTDDREDDGDDLEPDVDGEYSNGWTDHIDQTLLNQGGQFSDAGEGEPDLGFVGIGTGWREGEDTNDYEPWLGWTEDQAARYSIPTGDEFSRKGQGPALFDGRGVVKAEELLASAKPRIEPYSRIIGTRNHFLKDGSVFTTFVPR